MGHLKKLLEFTGSRKLLLGGCVDFWLIDHCGMHFVYVRQHWLPYNANQNPTTRTTSGNVLRLDQFICSLVHSRLCVRAWLRARSRIYGESSLRYHSYCYSHMCVSIVKWMLKGVQVMGSTMQHNTTQQDTISLIDLNEIRPCWLVNLSACAAFGLCTNVWVIQL